MRGQIGRHVDVGVQSSPIAEQRANKELLIEGSSVWGQHGVWPLTLEVGGNPLLILEHGENEILEENSMKCPHCPNKPS